MTAADRHLQKFSTEWTRSIYVGLANEQARELVKRGWLEKRQAPPPFEGWKGNTATEYRLTEAGQHHLREVHAA